MVFLAAGCAVATPAERQGREIMVFGQLLPAGTRVDVTMFFDNSVENDYVPNPDRAVRFGGPTTDEMMLGWISMTDAEPKPDPLVSPGTD